MSVSNYKSKTENEDIYQRANFANKLIIPERLQISFSL